MITPVFNCLPYLLDTLASVKCQSLGLDAIEMLAIDDGSTDGSLEVLREWAAAWPGLRVLTSDPPSGGPSRPRNIGIENAVGDYVFFLDGDDCLGPQALARMVSMAQQHDSDVVLGKIVGVGRQVQVEVFRENVGRADLTGGIYDSLTPTKLFRRALLLDHDLRFPEHMRVREDQHFVAGCYLAASSVSVVADYDCYYAVRRRNGSNITTIERLSRPTILSQVEETIRLIRSKAPRDALPVMMLRHVRRDLLSPFGRQFLSRPARERSALIDAVSGYAGDWATPEVMALLSVPERLRLVAIERHLPELLLDVVRWDVQGAHARIVRVGSTFCLEGPGFRSPELALPDALFALPGPPSCIGRLERVTWRAGTLQVEGHAYLEGISSADTTLHVVARQRESHRSIRATLVRTATPHVNASCGHEVVDYTTAGFRAELDLAATSFAAPDAWGTWDVLVGATIGDHEAEVPLASSQARAQEQSRAAAHPGAHAPEGEVMVTVRQAADGLSMVVEPARRTGP